MATMTVTVKSSVPVALLPKAGPTTVTDYFTQVSVFIPVPPGETRYVQEIYSPGAVGGVSQTQTINTDTTIVLTLEGFVNQDPTQNQDYFAYVRVSLSAADPIFYTKGISRNCDTSQIL